METTPNWKAGIDLSLKCGACKYYEPFIKKGTLTARGRCTLKAVYKQRGETCLKYKRGAG